MDPSAISDSELIAEEGAMDAEHAGFVASAAAPPAQTTPAKQPGESDLAHQTRRAEAYKVANHGVRDRVPRARELGTLLLASDAYNEDETADKEHVSIWGDVAGTTAYSDGLALEATKKAQEEKDAATREKEAPVLELMRHLDFITPMGKLTGAALTAFCKANRPTFSFARAMNDKKTLDYATKSVQIEVILRWLREGEYEPDAEPTEGDLRATEVAAVGLTRAAPL